MRKFCDADFLLRTETARYLYHEHAALCPIIDFHNHLNQRDILDDTNFSDISDIWLGVDHYKWRAMRANGVEERYITGDATAWEKFEKWAGTVPRTFGNPLYHWTHLELRRYFGIEEPLSPQNARAIYEKCNEMLKREDFSVRNLLRRQKVETLCTTDDPADSLEDHIAIAKSDCDIAVLPTYRPDRALGIDKQDFAEYIKKLGESAGETIEDFAGLLSVMKKRLDFFVAQGCRVTDHALDERFYEPASQDEVDAIFRRALGKETLTNVEVAKYRGSLLKSLAELYHGHSLVMQLHIGPIRNNSTRGFRTIGPDAGFDSPDDFNYARRLSAFLDSLDSVEKLPKTILYCLNPKDNLMLAAMAGNFQTSEARGKVQFGTAWWFLDTKRGMQEQIDTLSSVGLLSSFIGMLTDSRSFLSFPRHEYFRRILCNYMGDIVENYEYPNDREFLGAMVEDICYNNAKAYFNL